MAKQKYVYFFGEGDAGMKGILGGKEVFGRAGIQVPVTIGAMIEAPRAAIRSAHRAGYADFFSFGANERYLSIFANLAILS